MQGKNIFITGSTRGIGKGMAMYFAKLGANIVINGRSEISEELLNEVRSYGVQAIGVHGDIADFSSCQEMILRAEKELGPIDVLINNAGITKDKLLMRMSDDDFNDVLKINLCGTFNMTQQMVKLFMKRRSGAIINLSSVVGLTGNIGQANYAASKAGVIGFTKSVAREVAGRGISVNAIAPGFIQTEMTDVLSDKIKEQLNASIPMKRFGTVDDVAQAAHFLATHKYITGQVINIDGGMVMN
ncbi:MAG: 3-oxoacyl-[acyl-carrier-protein] reductase [Streptococcaceae bacterium]|jgi:3-oxoacyl-[acyl-carrier protein] reductase|nr:3-oxoacyl-[acyl-carrier-protein] reductase [Streptococcaceae bacterium]